ncbi:MAG: hypothetical protein AB1810_07210 [Pseudomonadota bacterium]
MDMKIHLSMVVGVSLSGMTNSVSLAYPNGPGMYVTDAAPFCASCHAATKAEYMPEMPADLAKGETPENKHYRAVNAMMPPSPYVELTSEERAAIIDEARFIDERTTVTLDAPRQVAASAQIEVRVKAKGGNGPAIGVMLVDKALRYQSRPISAAGWQIIGPPQISGQDGKPQTKWLDGRITGLAKNLSFILITDQQYDRKKQVFPAGDVVFKLQAPSTPGRYSLCAALLYGTENATTAAVFQRPSGRILFSEEIAVTVGSPS